MTNDIDNGAKELAHGLRKVLNREGYAFHHSVLKAIRESGVSWRPEAVELPVNTKQNATGFDTRIDLVLSRYKRALYLVGECKRVNPAVSNWCFVRAPQSVPGSAERPILEGVLPVILEEVTGPAAHGSLPASKGVTAKYDRNVYSIGLPLRSREPGDAVGKPDRDAIEQAATQVMKAVSGMVAFLARHEAALLQRKHISRLIPVIFTTARIWTSDVDLSAADLATGDLDPAAMNVAEKPWVWFQYHLSPGIKHDLVAWGDVETFRLQNIVEREYARSIAVVNPKGLAEFLDERDLAP